LIAVLLENINILSAHAIVDQPDDIGTIGMTEEPESLDLPVDQLHDWLVVLVLLDVDDLDADLLGGVVFVVGSENVPEGTSAQFVL
jgi:hypothetical protein